MEVSALEILAFCGGCLYLGYEVGTRAVSKAMYSTGWQDGATYIIENTRRFVVAGIKHLTAIGELSDEEIEAIENSDMWGP